MAYPYDAADLAALSRLQVTYNGGDYDAGSNPGGFGQGGHVVNFVPALADVAIAGGAVADAAESAEADASAAAASATAAAASAANLQGTSTTSNTVAVGSKSFTTQSGKSFAAGLPVAITSAANPTVNRMGGIVSSYSGTALVVDVTEIGSGSGNTATDWTIRVSGAPGIPGGIGLDGLQGATPAAQLTFLSTITDSDPGNGCIKFNHGTIENVEWLYINNVDYYGSVIADFVDTMDDSTNTVSRGTVTCVQIGDQSKRSQFSVTGVVIDGIGYRKVPVDWVSGILPTNNEPLALAFSRTGDRGSDGAGAGDLVSIETTVTDGHFILFNGPTGKSAKTAGFGFGTAGAVLGKLDGDVAYSGTRTFATLADFQQQIRLSGDISPTTLSANQNDYNPTNLSTSNVLRLTSDASRDVTGLQGGADGRLLLLENVGANNIVLKNASGLSSAANRFGFGADVTLGANQSVLILYDSTSLLWRLCHPFIAGASGHTVVYADGANIWSGVQTFAAKVDFQQDIYESGDISPTQIAANTNDYNPTNLASSSVLRLTSDASRNITGLQGGADGRKITFINVGSNPIVLKNADAASSAANRFLFGADIILTAEQSIALWYDSTSSRWRLSNAFIKPSQLVVTVKKQVFTATGTYTPSTGMLYCLIELVGGGAGGGSSAGSVGQIHSGAGGGAGGFSRLLAIAATIGASQAVTIGGAGVGGASGSNNGANGGDTSVGSLCIGKGGSGGKFGSIAQVPTGGAGGVAGTGDLTAAGAPGLPGFYNSLNLSIAFPSGSGGASFFGGSAAGVNANTSAVAGVTAGNYGGGGSGAATNNVAANEAGGNGSNGVVWITEYCSQ